MENKTLGFFLAVITTRPQAYKAILSHQFEAEEDGK